MVINVQLQVAGDPANHRATDRPIGRYHRLSSLLAQAKNCRCRVNLRFRAKIIMPSSHRRDKCLLSRPVVGQCEFAIKPEYRSMTIKI